MNNWNLKDQSAKAAGFLTLPIIRDLSITCAVLTILYKLITSEISINLAEFSFNDLLALILALFSIWLSTAFYFKANEAANQFYHNTFEFTQQTSVILGRIESGFGEKFNSLNNSLTALEKTRQVVERANSDLAETDEAGQRIFKELIEKAKLENNEKEVLINQLNEIKAERDRALQRLNESINSESKPRTDFKMTILSSMVLNSLFEKLPRDASGKIIKMIARHNLQNQIFELPDSSKKHLENRGIISSEGNITDYGWNIILKRIDSHNGSLE